jgi:hypothetical protein
MARIGKGSHFNVITPILVMVMRHAAFGKLARCQLVPAQAGYIGYFKHNAITPYRNNMADFIVLGKCRRVTLAVLQALRSFTNGECLTIGGAEISTLRRSILCKRQIIVDMNGADDDRFVELMAGITCERPHAILIPVDCDAVRMVNRLRKRLRLGITPIPDTATLDMFDNKWSFHQFCMQAGLAVPATRHLATKTALDYAEIAAELGESFVVKPLDKAGSTGVRTIRSSADYDNLILDDDSYDYGPLIAQRYIDGPDIDISLLALQGRVTALAIQQARDSRIQFVPHAELEVITTWLCAISAYNGPMHIDARIETATGKLYLIESNPRFWASLTASVWCGLNFVAESIEQPLGNQVLRLTSGVAPTRHPLIRPSCWHTLLTDKGERGCLLRAMAFDPPTLKEFIKELAASRWRRVMQHTDAAQREPHALPAPVLADEVRLGR